MAYSSINFYLIVIGFLSTYIRLAFSDFEVCNPENNPALYKFTQANCPFGVLFNQPITAHCMASTNEPGHFFTDICDQEKFTINLDDRPYKIQLAFHMNEEGVDAQNTCQGDVPEKCNTTTVVEASSTTLTEPQEDEDEAEEEILTDEEKARQNDTLVIDQTERLFKFMFGLSADSQESGPHMRLTKILSQSFNILAKFCDTKYVPLEFGKDILKAFLFLVRESELSRLQDISVPDYESIKMALDGCEGRSPSFKFVGKTCKTHAHVGAIEKNGRTSRFTKDEHSFKWGKYDIAVDATWGVLNFVHGLCYDTFKSHVNLHHLFQRAAELLFSKEILYRWNHPPKLHYEDLWDHVFSASTKNTMRNLDACVYAAYHGAPFLHRLERPLDSSNATAPAPAPAPSTSSKKRKRRSLSTMTLDEGGLEGVGWCFKSELDLLKTTEAFVDINCPDSRKAFDELKRIREFLKSTNDTTGADPADP